MGNLYLHLMTWSFVAAGALLTGTHALLFLWPLVEAALAERKSKHVRLSSLSAGSPVAVPSAEVRP